MPASTGTNAGRMLTTVAGTVMAAMLTIAALATTAQADDRFRRYFDSVSRCGVVGYCTTTADDILRRGPTGGTNSPWERLYYRDYPPRRGHYHWRNTYRPRGAFPQMYVDIRPSDQLMVRPGRRAAAWPKAHRDWCTDRYRSYRVSDNSFQPNKGPRRACHSPFR